jgi:serine/threonine protein kinase
LEFCQGGELLSWMKRNERFSEDVCRFFCCEILIALEYIHSNNCIYRDLKPENVLIDKFGHVKIADFGFVKKIQQKTYSTVGTLVYLAPEILIESGHDFGVDFWSFGVLMYEMLVGYSPFDGETKIEVFKKINEGKVTFPKGISKVAKSLIKKLLNKEKSERIGCLKGGINDIKEHPFFAGVDWMKVVEKKYPSPLKLEFEDEGSTKYFIKNKGSRMSTDSILDEKENALFKDF